MRRWQQRWHWLQPYIELARWRSHTGWLLLFWPCGWGIALATLVVVSSPPSGKVLLSDLHYLAMDIVALMVGAFLARSCGCVWNDYLDRHIDADIDRTKNRPLARQAVTTTNALIFALMLLLASLAWAWLMIPAAALVVALLSAPLVLVYPLCKRTRIWPQLLLGAIFPWGIWVGWACVAAENPIVWEQRGVISAFLLYASAYCWTVGYDTIYACQDRLHDRALGVSSLAAHYSDPRRPIAIAYGFTALFLTGSVMAVGLGWWALFMLAAAVPLFWQVWKMHPARAHLCWQSFRANGWWGGVVMVMLTLAAGVHSWLS